MDFKDFQRQHVLITGGSSGIGKATALLLAKAGANVSLIARDPEKLAIAKAEIEAVKSDAQQIIFTVAADVSNQAEIDQAIQQAIATVGEPDILIASAGIARPGYFQELPLNIFEDTMAINYFGTLYAIKSVLPMMQKNQRGHLVLISSGAGLIGLYGYSPYSPSKFAIRGLAEALRGELKCFGIGVSIVYPPDTDTPQLVAENKTKPEETKQITGSAAMWSAEQVAASIVQGIAQKKFAITPGLEMKLLCFAHSLLSPMLNWYFDGIVKKVRGI
jgi:3-dehydrosphinganine reductase